MQASPFGAYGFGISVALVGIMLSMGGLLLGVGYAINDKRLREFGRGEILQSLINGALVGGFLILFVNGGLVSALIGSTVLSGGTSISCSSFLQANAAICFAYNYLVGQNQYYFLGVYHSSVLASVMSLMSTFISLYAVLGLFKTFLSPLLALIQTSVQIMSTAAISAIVQASVLMAIAVGALTVVLPLGLVLRSFYPTRMLGSFLIALTIGLYIIFPLSYLMNATIASYYSSASTRSGITTLTLNASSIKSSAFDYASQNLNSTTGIIAFLSGVGSEIEQQVSGLLNDLFNAVAYFVVSAFILPAFSLMLTGISVRELSKLLGSDGFLGKFNLL